MNNIFFHFKEKITSLMRGDFLFSHLFFLFIFSFLTGAIILQIICLFFLMPSLFYYLYRSNYKYDIKYKIKSYKFNFYIFMFVLLFTIFYQIEKNLNILNIDLDLIKNISFILYSLYAINLFIIYKINNISISKYLFKLTSVNIEKIKNEENLFYSADVIFEGFDFLYDFSIDKVYLKHKDIIINSNIVSIAKNDIPLERFKQSYKCIFQNKPIISLSDDEFKLLDMYCY